MVVLTEGQKEYIRTLLEKEKELVSDEEEVRFIDGILEGLSMDYRIER